MRHIHVNTRLLQPSLVIEKAGVKSGQSIADLGCGKNGHLAFHLTGLVGSRGRVYAVDIIKSHLDDIDGELKRQAIKNLRTVWSDLERIGATDIEESSLDVAFIINTLHQAQKPLDLLREAVRLTKSGAKVVVVDWSRYASPLGPDDVYRIDKNKLVDSVKKIGLYLDNEFSAGQYHFGLVLKKI